MIVEEPPYEMVAVFADADAKYFVQTLIERGQDRSCLRQFRWRSVRDAMRDAVWSQPVRVLSPFLRIDECRFLLVWDHEGSGRENDYEAGAVEEEVIGALERAGISRSRIEAIALTPEFEGLLTPVWDRAKQMICQIRRTETVEDAVIFERAIRLIRRKGADEPADFPSALEGHPKEVALALLSIVNLRSSPALFKQLAERLSIPRIKLNSQAQRLSRKLEEWFATGGAS